MTTSNNFGDLIQRQQDTGEEIRRLARNYKKDGESRRTPEYLQKKLRTLEQLWSDFEETDTQIRTNYADRLEHPYFTKGYYDGIAAGYDEVRQDITTHLQSARNQDTLIGQHPHEDALTDFNVPGDMIAPQAATTDETAAAAPIHQQSLTKGFVTGAIPKECKFPPDSKSRNPPNQISISSLINKQQTLMNALQQLLSTLPPQTQLQPVQYYQMKIRSIEGHLGEVQSLHYKIWGQTDTPRAAGYDIEAFFNFEEQVQHKLAQLYEQVNQTTSELTGNSSADLASTPHNNVMVKLPKIVLPIFDGNYLKWRQFRDLFMELVHKQPISECQKLWYLKTSLSGEAEKLIRHLTSSEANYAAAWKIVNDRYENTRLLVNALLNKLISQPASSNENAVAVKSLHDTTQECLLALENLGVPTDQWDPLLLHLLIKKLDKSTHTLWEQSLAQPRKLQSFKSFLDFLQTRFQSLEALGNKGKSMEEKGVHTLRALASTTAAQPNCPACKGNHKIFSCQRFLQLSPDKRIRVVKEANLCFNCLRPGHNLAACPSSRCTKCSRKHNTLLHPPATPVNKEGTNANPRKGQPIARQSSTNNQAATETARGDKQASDSSIVLTTKTAPTAKTYVLLSTVLVKLSNGKGLTVECRAILDSGSQINFITEKMANKLNLRASPELMYIEGIGQRKQQAQRRINVILESRINGFSTRLEAYVLPQIVSPQPTQHIDITTWPIPPNIQLADPRFNQPDSIDLLIGAELYYALLSVGQIKLGDSLPTLQNTIFGWTASGRTHLMTQRQATCAIGTEQDLDQQLERFWRLEDTAPSTDNFTFKEKRCESYFVQSTRRDATGRFVVRLPFQVDPSQLGESKDIALQRFTALERRLARQPELKELYSQFMNEYIRLGHMKEVDFNKIEPPYYFLPHHCVVKPNSTTTKLRVVFDASAKTSSNVSLNEVLSTGPTIQDDVFSILLRFRMPRFVFTADIEKMYRQVMVDEADQRYQLIWWRSNPTQGMKCFQLGTVTYGTTCAPYLATRCLQRLSDEEAVNYPLGAEVLARDFYVDDVLTGSNSLATAVEMQSQLKQILQSAGFRLRKWCANHPRLLNNIAQEDQELQLDFSSKSEENIKTIGLTWLPKTDEFIIKTSWNEREKVTKRTALSDIAHLFDPLGIMAPVTVIAKIFLQKLWALKLDWDAALPQELATSWNRYREGLKSLNYIKCSRHVFSHKKPKLVQFHIFADASEKAYGAAAYVRSLDTDNVITVRLLCAKSRVAPIKQVTLPRLELCAAKIAAELAQRLRKDLDLKDEKIYLWTDSEIVLSWITASSSSFQTFVANRVSVIQQLSTPEQWRHVASKDNPADVLSRGIAPEKLSTCIIWFYGPQFLHGNEAIWPNKHIQVPLENDLERRRKATSATVVDNSEHFIYSVNHKNSFRKLQRIIAYVLRFIAHAKRKVVQSSMNTARNTQEFVTHAKRKVSQSSMNIVFETQELEESEAVIVKLMQYQEFQEDIRHLKRSGEVAKTSPMISLTPFLDEKGIIRVGGRIEASNLSFNAKHPMLVPYSHQFTKLLINDIHKENNHVGPQTLLAITRQKFWPIKGKTLTRSVVQHCVQCAKARPKLLTQLMGNLPADRVQPARPFVNVGIDFCGPFHTHFKIRGKRPQKSYIAVFCCFTTKATHLEVVSDLSTQGFLGALKRFTGRRGHCKNIYCDNASNFVGAKNLLQEVKNTLASEKERERIMTACSSKGIDFHFIPPRAPHFGGLWEAAVKSAKHLLQRVLSSASLTYEELETAVIDVEAILNSRPITPMSSNPNDLTALTPGHFLIGEPLTSSIDSSAQPRQTDLLTRWKLVSYIKNEFWRRWSNEYLSQLQHRYKWKQRCQSIEPGNMVVIKEDNMPALKWSLGRVVNVIKGSDGLVRVADVRTSSGILRRAIHKLAPLPIESEQSPSTNRHTGDSESETEEPEASTSQGTQSSENKKHSQDKVTSNPRKKQRRSLGSALVTMLLTCLILPMSKGSPVTISPFKSDAGIYFENLGVTNIVSNEWHLIAYYDMDPYWREFSTFVNCTTQLEKLCSAMSEGRLCVQIINQFKHLKEEIAKDNDLLLPTTDKTRTKRGAFNLIGNLANTLFGVLDSEYAEKMSKTIDDIKGNENFLLELVKNQTTIMDATVNIMKKKEERVISQFNEIESQVNEIMKQINGIKEELFQEKSSQLFTSLGIQTMLIASNLHRTQDSILDVIINTHHGKISPQLISPAQLREELAKIKNSLPSSLRLPTMQDDVLKYYNLMTIEGRVVEKHIIFKISLPLLIMEDFELFKITPVPVLVNDTFVAIRPSFPYLVINLHRDLYYPLTEQEMMTCVSINQDRHLCKQKRPMYHKGSAISACEIDLINHLPQSNSCQIMKTADGPHWIELHNPNQWIYVLRHKTTLNIVCGDNLTQTNIEGSGILKIQGNCVVKQPLITIRGHHILPSSSRMSYVPASNLTDFLVPEKLTPMFHHTSHYQPELAELEAIKTQLSQLPRDLPAKVQIHDAHQFTIGYLGLFLTAAIISYLIWKQWITQRGTNSKNSATKDMNSEDLPNFNTNFDV